MRKAGTGAVEWVQSVEKRLATNPAWSAQRACRRHIVGKLIICKEKPMPELSHIDPRSAALLVMDYQGRYPHQVHDGCAVRRCDRVRASSDSHGPRRGHDGDPCRCRIPARSSRGQPS